MNDPIPRIGLSKRAVGSRQLGRAITWSRPLNPFPLLSHQVSIWPAVARFIRNGVFVLAGLVCLPAHAAPDYYLSFNGSNYTSTGADPSVFAVSTGTFELWYRSTDTTDDRLFAGTYNYNGGYCFKVYNSGSTSMCRFVFVHSGGGVEVEQTSSVNIRDGEWHHLAATWDSGTVSLWIDGVFEWSDLISTPVAGGNMMFGCVPASAHIEACDIGLVRLSSSVQYTASPFTPPTTFTADGSTVGLWTMAEGSGVTAHDSSANDYDATLYPDSNANYPVWSLGGGTSTIGITVDPVATDIAYDSASILWSVANTTGQEAAHTVYYWRDGAANTPTNSASASSDPGNGQVSVTLTNLLLGQSYDYYVQSSNAVASATAPTASPGYNQFTTADVGSGYYLSFNGGNHAVATNSEAFAPSAGTFELWYRSTDTTDDRLFAGTYNDGGGYCFKVYNSGGTSKCRFVFVDGASPPELEQTSSVNIRDGQWHHLAATWGNNELRLWIDGEFENFVEILSPVTGGNMMFGCVPASDHIEACDIGLARLSDSERYTGTSFSPPTTLIADSNTVGLWTMADGSGETANDSSGNDYDAALVNNPTWGSEVIVITVAPAATNITCNTASILWTVTNTTSRTALHTVHYWLDGTDGILNPSIAAAGSDPGSGQVSVSLGSLEANQTYDYYVRSSNIVACVTSPAGSFSQFATKAYVIITNTPTRGDVHVPTRSTTLTWGIENTSWQDIHNAVTYTWVAGAESGEGTATCNTSFGESIVTITITNLIAGATYTFNANSTVDGHDGDPAYSQTSSGSFTVTTEELPLAPAICIFNVSSNPGLVSNTMAVITWNVVYANPSDYGTASHFVLVSSNGPPTTLSQVLFAPGEEDDNGNVWAMLSGLSPGQTNYFCVQSVLDAITNRFVTDDNGGLYYSFTNTVLGDVVSDPLVGPISITQTPTANFVSDTEAIIVWQVSSTNCMRASHCVLYDANSPPTLQSCVATMAIQCDDSNVVAVLSQLQPGCTYNYCVQSVGDFGGGHFATDDGYGLYYSFTTQSADSEPPHYKTSSVNDGIPDWWKLNFGFSLTDPSLADTDADADFFTTLQEYLGATDARDSGSSPATTGTSTGVVQSNVTINVTIDLSSVAVSEWFDNADGQCVKGKLKCTGPGGVVAEREISTEDIGAYDWGWPGGAGGATANLSFDIPAACGETYTFAFEWTQQPTVDGFLISAGVALSSTNGFLIGDTLKSWWVNSIYDGYSSSTEKNLIIGYDEHDLGIYIHPDVPAENESAKSWKVTVSPIKTQTIATLPKNRARRKLGIGEEVRIELVTPADVVVTWGLKSGNGSLSHPSEYPPNATLFTASGQEGKVEVEGTAANGSKVSVEFDVIAPKTVKFVRVDGGLRQIGSPVGFVMHVWLEWFFGPDDVCFYNLVAGETGVDPDLSGFFESDPAYAERKHKAWIAGEFGDLTTIVIPGKGTMGCTPDETGLSACEDLPCYPINQTGRFEWNLHWKYRLKNDTGDGTPFYPVMQWMAIIPGVGVNGFTAAAGKGDVILP
ncbi:MAG: LamG-like jellyroll fold domain-containing protein [Verrucomicrobiia bacterium]